MFFLWLNWANRSLSLADAWFSNVVKWKIIFLNLFPLRFTTTLPFWCWVNTLPFTAIGRPSLYHWDWTPSFTCFCISTTANLHSILVKGPLGRRTWPNFNWFSSWLDCVTWSWDIYNTAGAGTELPMSWPWYGCFLIFITKRISKKGPLSRN